MTSALISGIVIFILYGILIPLGKSHFSIDRSQVATNKTPEELKKEYQKYQLISIPLSLLFMLVLAVTAYYMFIGLESLIPTISTSNEVVASPSRGLFILVIIGAAIINVDIVVFGFFQLVLKKRYKEFRHYYDSTYGFITGAFMKKFKLFVCTPLFITVFVLGADWYVKFTSEKIVVNDFLSFKVKEFAISEVEGIYQVSKSKAPNGKIYEREHYAIKFNNGAKWHGDMALTFPETKEDIEKGVIQIAQKTGKTIEAIDYLE